MKAFLLMVALLCWPVEAATQTGLSYALSGYAKTIGLRTTSFFTGERFFYELSRLRLQNQLDLGDRLHAELWVDTEWFFGSFLKTLDYRLWRATQPVQYLNLTRTITDTDRLYWRLRVFRGYVTLQHAGIQLTMGRQRISWGTGFAWNPTDLFNPFNPFAIERDEKDAVDVLYLEVPIGVLSRFEAAYAPATRTGRARAAVRVHSNIRQYDVSFMAGTFRGDWVIGGDFSGYVGGAGLRGEVAYTMRQGKGGSLRAILNMDYNFPHDYYAMIELYYNGPGTTDANKYDYFALLRGETFSLAKHYLAALLSKSPMPLLQLNFYTILNLNDGSGLLGPAAVYSVAENLDFTLSVYYFMGDDQSELGRLGTSLFFMLQYYF